MQDVKLGPSLILQLVTLQAAPVERMEESRKACLAMVQQGEEKKKLLSLMNPTKERRARLHTLLQQILSVSRAPRERELKFSQSLFLFFLVVICGRTCVCVSDPLRGDELEVPPRSNVTRL